MGNSMEKSNFLQQENVHRIALTKEQQKNFSRHLKRGICRELHAQSLLTDEQLGILLNELEE
ncbi:hypothetical protein NE477_09165 [Blautia marasmi]|nr:hypothetical protein [Blautia marasmi]MBS5265651.1 hypothetical protein [Clostridiales bacterium]MCQ4645819.1 hypothetical protein [Blautia marasmi]MCQ4869965.1 hypothetical protein [Blautia producta]